MLEQKRHEIAEQVTHCFNVCNYCSHKKHTPPSASICGSYNNITECVYLCVSADTQRERNTAANVCSGWGDTRTQRNLLLTATGSGSKQRPRNSKRMRYKHTHTHTHTHVYTHTHRERWSAVMASHSKVANEEKVLVLGPVVPNIKGFWDASSHLIILSFYLELYVCKRLISKIPYCIFSQCTMLIKSNLKWFSSEINS